MTVRNLKKEITLLKYRTTSKPEDNTRLANLLETLRIMEECKRKLSHEQIRECTLQATRLFIRYEYDTKLKMNNED